MGLVLSLFVWVPGIKLNFSSHTWSLAGLSQSTGLAQWATSTRSSSTPCRKKCPSLTTRIPPPPEISYKALKTKCRSHLGPGSFSKPELKVSSVSHLTGPPCGHHLSSGSHHFSPVLGSVFPTPNLTFSTWQLPRLLFLAPNETVISCLKYFCPSPGQLDPSYLASTQNPTSYSPPSPSKHALYIQKQQYPSISGILCYPMFLSCANMAHFCPSSHRPGGKSLLL